MSSPTIIATLVLALLMGLAVIAPFWLERRPTRRQGDSLGDFFWFMVGLLLTVPFGQDRRIPLTETGKNTGSLKEQLERTLNAVRDLDFDYDTGKIMQEEYILQRKMLVGRGAGILARMDEIAAQRDPLDQDIEQMIAAARQKSAPR